MLLFDFNTKHHTDNKQRLLQTTFQNEERSNEKIVIIFLKKNFNIKFLSYPSILLVDIGYI